MAKLLNPAPVSDRSLRAMASDGLPIFTRKEEAIGIDIPVFRLLTKHRSRYQLYSLAVELFFHNTATVGKFHHSTMVNRVNIWVQESIARRFP